MKYLIAVLLLCSTASAETLTLQTPVTITIEGSEITIETSPSYSWMGLSTEPFYYTPRETPEEKYAKELAEYEKLKEVAGKWLRLPPPPTQ